MNKNYIGAIDLGTTGTRFIIFNHIGQPIASSYREHRQIYPHLGWVEHDLQEIWCNTQFVVKEALQKAALTGKELVGIGITNQRETAVAWEIKTGEPVYNAIVWQDRRTTDRCSDLKRLGFEELIRKHTGLRIDPYFSATKFEWLLKNVNGLRQRVEEGRVIFGTLESWLVWHLTGGDKHISDYTNASRTLLFDIKKLEWDEELLKIFGVPRQALPELRPSVEIYGRIKSIKELEGLPIGGALGDQHAALFGQTCFSSGEIKITHGTGSFLLLNVGKKLPSNIQTLLSTVAYALSKRDVWYALEGAIFSAGATIQWLRDGLGIIEEPSESENLAKALHDNEGVYLVPAFTGLGAPHWDPYARGIIVGLTRSSDRRHLARASLEAIAYQTEDILQVIRKETDFNLSRIKVDGGVAKNNFLCQFQSDISNIQVTRPAVTEVTALGAAYAAGLSTGFWTGLQQLKNLSQQKAEVTFFPQLNPKERSKLYAGWQRALSKAKG